MSGAPFPILLASGLAVTAPEGGVEGRLTLSPYDASDPRQKFVTNKNIFFSPAQNTANVLEIQLGQGRNEAEEGDAVEIKKRNNANLDNQIWQIQDGVVNSSSYPEYTLGFGSVALVKKDSVLGLASAPAAQVTIKNGTGGPVYISYETVPDGATQVIQVPKGKTLRAIDSNGAVISPTPVEIKGNQTIALSRNLSITVSNDTPFRIKLKPDVAGPSTAFIEPGVKNVVITAPFGSIYRAFDPADKPLMFVDDVKLNALDFVLVDEAIEIYHVVVPCTNVFINNTPGTIYLSTTSNDPPPVAINAKGQYSSTVPPGTTYQARDISGNALTISSVSDANKSGLTISVKESDDFFRITVTPPVPTYPITLNNTTNVAIKVTVEGSAQTYTINANSRSESINLKQGTFIIVESVPAGTPVAPERKRIDAAETVNYTSGLQLAANLVTAIQGWLPNKKFTLIYKASRDGFNSIKFHNFCDNAGPTITIITSIAGHKFGGYTPDNWGVAGYGRDKSAFIFTLTNPHNIGATKFALVDNVGIMPFATYGAAFGAGNDIYVSADPNSDNKSYTNFPISYGPDTTAKKENLFTGAKYYLASDVEVYKVQS